MLTKSTIIDEYGFAVENTPMGEMRVISPVRLVGAQPDGTTVDSTFWTVTNANGGTTTQGNAQFLLSTNTTANGSTVVSSVRRSRYVSGSSNRYRSVIQLGDSGTSNNKRRWGIAYGASMPTITDGAWFQLDGVSFSVVIAKGGSETVINSGSFNGTIGKSYSPATSATTYEIYWTNSNVYFVIGGEILHKLTAESSTWSNTMNHYVYADNVNRGGSTTNTTIAIRVHSIYRLGNISTQPMFKWQSGTTAGVVCKYGPGNLHGISVSGISNNSVITLYDNTTAGGTVIWSSGAMTSNSVPFALEFHNVPFSTGLTFDITAANSNLFIAYE